MSYFLNAIFEPDLESGGFVVTFPDLPWGVTQGGDEAEAFEMAQDAALTVLEDYIQNDRDLPAPSAPRRGKKYRQIGFPALQSAKLELYRAFRSSRMRKSELAKRLGIPKSNVERLFDLRHSTRLNQLEKAFAVLHKRLSLNIEDAA